MYHFQLHRHHRRQRHHPVLHFYLRLSTQTRHPAFRQRRRSRYHILRKEDHHSTKNQTHRWDHGCHRHHQPLPDLHCLQLRRGSYTLIQMNYPLLNRDSQRFQSFQKGRGSYYCYYPSLCFRRQHHRKDNNYSRSTQKRSWTLLRHRHHHHLCSPHCQSRQMNL